MEKIYNLFKFIEDKYPEYRTPFKYKIIYEIPLTKEDLNIKGDLHLIEMDNFVSLPKGLIVGRDLFLNYSFSVKLPEGLIVGGDLSLEGCEIIKPLPKGLKIGGSFLVYASDGLKSLPKDISVGGNVDLRHTPLSEKYTAEQIRKMCPGIKGEIFI
jgi:hypothetical protein